MREWEKRDIVDVLVDHHLDLMVASAELSEGGDDEGCYQLDNDAIVIEHYLETDHGLEWDGTKFQMGENPYTVDKNEAKDFNAESLVNRDKN